MTHARRGRPRLYDGPPVRVRLPAELYDALCHDALHRACPVSDVIREHLARGVKVEPPTA